MIRFAVWSTSYRLFNSLVRQGITTVTTVAHCQTYSQNSSELAANKCASENNDSKVSSVTQLPPSYKGFKNVLRIYMELYVPPNLMNVQLDSSVSSLRDCQTLVQDSTKTSGCGITQDNQIEGDMFSTLLSSVSDLTAYLPPYNKVRWTIEFKVTRLEHYDIIPSVGFLSGGEPWEKIKDYPTILWRLAFVSADDSFNPATDKPSLTPASFEISLQQHLVACKTKGLPTVNVFEMSTSELPLPTLCDKKKL